MDLVEVKKLVEEQIAKIEQTEIKEVVLKHRTTLRMEKREWDYSDSFTEYLCCIVLEDKITNTAIVYCENGFGPSNPWGLVFLEGENMSMGMDSAWFVTLEDAIRESMLWHGDNSDNYEVQ